MPNSPSRDIIREEANYLDGAGQEHADESGSPLMPQAIGHAQQQTKRAVTIGHYQKVLDAALRNLALDALFPELLGRIKELLEVDVVTVFLLEPDGRDLVARASIGLDQAVKIGLRIPVGVGIAGAVLETGISRTQYDINDATVANHVLVERGVTSLVAVPLPVANLTAGVLTAGSLRPRIFDSDEVHLLEVVAERVGLAIERTRILKLVQQERALAERASLFKTTLLQMASHDIKTPLTAMRLQVRILMDQAVARGEGTTALGMLDRNVKHLALILDDLLDMARLEAGKFVLHVTRVDLLSIGREVVQLFQAQAEQKGIELTLAADAVFVRADERRLIQVLVNLVSNSIRYTKHGGITLKMERIRDSSDQMASRIVLTDTGQGMTMEQVGHLFHPFAQVHENPQEGSGLGLYLCKQIIEAHGGQIRVVSPGPGQGTSVIIDLPHQSPSQATSEPEFNSRSPT